MVGSKFNKLLFLLIFSVNIYKQKLHEVGEKIQKLDRQAEICKTDHENFIYERNTRFNEVEKWKLDNEILTNKTQNLKQETEGLIYQNEIIAWQCMSIQSENIFSLFGNIIISVFFEVNNARETDFCLGISTNIGYITSQSCCQADELFLLDFDTGNQILMETDSYWMDENICIFNTTGVFDLNYGIQEENKKHFCSLLTYDLIQNEFDEQNFQFETEHCSHESCKFTFDAESLENKTILNGTLISCDQSSLFGLLTGKFAKNEIVMI